MANRSEFRRAGPRSGKAPRGTWLPVATLAALALVAACTEPSNKPLTAPPSIGGPNLAADVPFNAGDKCIAADAFLGGFTNGVNDSLKLASNKLCVSQDIKIATAIVDSISTDGGINYVKFTGQNTTCNSGDILFLQMAARVAETATSQRTDVGIWIGLNGGNARVGQCNHYNLVSQGIALGQTVAGVTNVEGDQCGDMNAGDTTLVQLGKIQVLCQGATAADSLVHIGSCLGWTQPGGDQVCPQPGTPGPNGFRFGTTPGTGSKCNCEGFNVPIRINQFAKLEVVKACQPSQITGATFDLTIDGLATTPPSADNVSCGGTTGAQLLDAGTQTNPGKVHTFAEGDFGGGFTGDDYTTTYACLNRGTNVSRGSGTSRGPNNITLQPNDDIVCTFTNTLRPQLKLVKEFVPTNDPGKVDFTINGVSFNNGGAGYGHGGTTGFQYVPIGSVPFSESGHTGTNLSEYGTDLVCRNAADAVISSNPGTGNRSGSVTTVAGDRITCTFTNKHTPRLGLSKTPDGTGTGSAISPGQIAKFTITLTDSLGGGPALNVAITDTLPAGVGDWTENPDQTECTITALAGETEKRVLNCSAATGGAPNELVQLNPGTSFTVIVQATVPTTFLQLPPGPAGDHIEIDGDLIDSPAGGAKDWANAGINCTSTPKVGCNLDKPTGQTDDSFGNGTKEDSPIPSVIDGSIPNNKSDLLRFYVSTERLLLVDYLYLAWERVQDPNGTTNMDFELNQSRTLTSNGVTPVRTPGDVLIKYDLSQGGVNPVLGWHKWVTSGACEANGAKPPCWGPAQAISVDVAAVINTVGVTDPIDPNAPRSIDPRTFGEASINLEAAGIFPPGTCVIFGAAYLKSRSSDSFTAAVKDFIAPIPVNITNCAPKDLINTAFARAANFAPPGKNLNDWFSDGGLIHVSDASGVTGVRLSDPTNLRLAQVQAAASGVIRAGVARDEEMAIRRRSVLALLSERAGTPWPPAVASGVGLKGGLGGPADNAGPPLRLLA